MSERGKLLDIAKDTINGDRQDSYGSPENSFQLISEYWNVYLDKKRGDRLTPKDVAQMMSLLKLARIQNDTQHKDSYVDMLGYIALASEMK